MAVSSERIREIDISRQARVLRFLRFTDYLLVVLCGTWLLNLVTLPFIDHDMRQSEGLIFTVIAVAVLSFNVYTGWRHVGVIDERVWRSHLLAFPLLILFCVTVAASTLFMAFGNDGGMNLEDYQTISGFFGACWLLVGATIGFISVLLLRRMRPETFGVPLVELLRDLRIRRGKRAIDVTSIKRVNAPRGIVIGVVGGIILLGVALAPLPDDLSTARPVMQISQQLSLVGYFLLIRARRYFQVSADSLLAADKRKPILFLRSFEDDEKVKFNISERALLDFSLETRLSNHFTYFGPFIAIGSPKEAIPQLGAARVILSDREWQPKVMAWMEAASVVVMYSGKTQWVTWELAKLVNTERVPKLILMIPEVKGWRSGTRFSDISARMEHVREAFRNTKWFAPLAAFENCADVRAMLFRSDGSLIVIKSRPRNRDSYHLAALIAHSILLDQSGAALVGISGPLRGQRLPVDKEIHRVGSASDNDLVINGDAYVSRFHACMFYENGNLSIADQRSTNGTFVNGNRLRNGAVTVNAGDQIGIGRSLFEVAHAESEDRPRAA
ncbi:MAG TPA: FHA domain-containing protein [Candidatus Binatia bacterium]|jgi:hypothetical protein